jgi:hypothetical protein
VVVDDQNGHVGLIVADGRRGDHTGNRTMQELTPQGSRACAAAGEGNRCGHADSVGAARGPEKAASRYLGVGETAQRRSGDDHLRV